MNNSNFIRQQATNDFEKAFTEGIINKFVKNIQGKGDDNQLLSLTDIMKVVKIKNQSYKGMQFVPVNKIVGSEGRYNDFDKKFLPRSKNLRNRWISVDEAHLKDINLPPIMIYKIGEVYFVRDGNHRVSVAKMQGRDFIDGEVTEIITDIKITPETTNDDLRNIILKEEKEDFLEMTELDKFRDVSKLVFSSPGRFDEVLTHINGHKYFLGLEHKRDITDDEAMLSWFDNLFMPFIEEIENNNFMLYFLGRTSADLYTWSIKHWDYLKKSQKKEIGISDAIKSYTNKFGQSPFKFLAKKIIKFFIK